MWHMAVRHYRVSPLRPKSAEENCHVLRRDRWRPRASAGGLDVVLVVGAGHRAVPPPPRAAARRMALLLAGRRPAGPLTTAEPRMGAEQGATEGATLTPGPGSGHRVTSRLGPGYPMSTPCSGWIRGVGWEAFRPASLGGGVLDELSLAMTTAGLVKRGYVGGVAARRLVDCDVPRPGYHDRGNGSQFFR